MKTLRTAIYCTRGNVAYDPHLTSLIHDLEGVGCEVSFVDKSGCLPVGTDILISVGGDGTFLSASMLAAERGIPILGVNFGRLGFLSETRPEGIAQLLARGEYMIEERIMLRADVSGGGVGNGDKGVSNAGVGPVGECAAGDGVGNVWPYALNEITVHRDGAAMLGVDVAIDGVQLPTYWADGLLVATPSGSTAYSLSVGGPIVMPQADVLVIAPISPHNLNVRPLIVPKSSKMEIALRSRAENVVFTRDNRTWVVDASSKISVSMAQFSLKRIRLNASNFINALTSKLFWGGDIRNSTE